MSSNTNRLALASALALMNLSLLGGCGDQSAPVAQSTPEPITTAKDDRAWLTRWGDYNMGPWTTDQLLADCADGRHSTKTLAWNSELDAWTPLGELFPEASITGSEEAGRSWTLLVERINDSFDQRSMMPTMDWTVTGQRSLLSVQDCRQVCKAGSWSPLGGLQGGS